MGSTNTDFVTSLVAVSRDNYKKQLYDNVFNEFALFNQIKDKSTVTIDDGGTNILVPVMVSANTNVDSVTYYSDLQTDPQKGFINASLTKAYYGVDFPISDMEISENMGESRIVNLVDGRMMQAEQSLYDRINGDMYSDGSGNGGLNIIGLLSMIPSASAGGTYETISATSNTKWVHKYTEGAASAVIAGLDSLYNKLADGRDKPDLLMTGPIGLGAYETALRAVGNPVVQNAKAADAGIASAFYKTIPMVLDQAATGTTAAGGEGTYGCFWQLNTRYLGLFFKAHGYDAPVRSEKKFADIYKMLTEIQLVCARRNRQGKHVLTS